MSEKVVPYRPLELMLDEKITDFDCQDFIGVWNKFVPAGFCDQLVDWFEVLYNKRTCQYDGEDEWEMFKDLDVEDRKSVV